MKANAEKIAVIGLGYVGLPVAIALAARYEHVLGYDISSRRVAALRGGIDWTGEVDDAELAASTLRFTDAADDLGGSTFFIVTVPTPIDSARQPDLSPLASACLVIGPRLSPGAIVVFESTVYPGVTEDVCGPLLEQHSGLKRGRDFFLGYSPERINPGDRTHRLETITKIVAAENEEALERTCAVYDSIIEAGLHVAPTIKVAEAAKVIENTQRDINIALMNEVSLIFERMNIRTRDVLDAAGTKWNFLPFTPGLVGGHCIGVDPYYLTSAAEQLGYRPEVILAGRRINDEMGAHIARRAVKMMIKDRREVNDARVGILGLTFKEDVPDLRNSKVPDIRRELREFGIDPLIADPLADADEAMHEYGIRLSPLEAMTGLDLLILAVNHRDYVKQAASFPDRLNRPGILIDIKSALDPTMFGQDIHYWSL